MTDTIDVMDKARRFFAERARVYRESHVVVDMPSSPKRVASSPSPFDRDRKDGGAQ